MKRKIAWVAAIGGTLLLLPLLLCAVVNFTLGNRPMPAGVGNARPTPKELDPRLDLIAPAIGAVGLGVNDWRVCLEALKHGDFDGFLLAGRYTLIDQSALAELLVMTMLVNVRSALP